MSHFSNNTSREFHDNMPCILAWAYMYCTNRKDYADALPYYYTTIRRYRYTDDQGIPNNSKVGTLERRSYVAQTLGEQSSNGKYDAPEVEVFLSVFCCKTNDYM
jgi:hypothetical protein